MVFRGVKAGGAAVALGLGALLAASRLAVVRRLDRLTGLVFLSFGVKLALVRQHSRAPSGRMRLKGRGARRREAAVPGILLPSRTPLPS
ncbi:MAG: hypothetical protein ACREUL_05730 [Steroidobacteraceae bacterium]